jgi:ribosome-binding factor A
MAKRGADKGARGSHHHARAQAAVLLELRTIVRDDVTDPELEGVRITNVVLTADLRSAKVHFSVPRGRPRPAVERAFERAQAFLRARLAEGAPLERIPDLRFVYESEIDPRMIDDEV